MDLNEELFIYSQVIAAVAMFNWFMGNRSILRRRLELRNEFIWVRLRWIGLGSVISFQTSMLIGLRVLRIC